MNSFQKQLLLWLKRAIKAAAFLLVFIIFAEYRFRYFDSKGE